MGLLTASYSVRHIPRPYTGGTDITQYVHALPLMTDTGLDEINTCKMELHGGFPAISHYDRFEVVITGAGGGQVSGLFEYAPADQSLTVSESKAFGAVTTLSLLGLEYHLDKIHYTNNIIAKSGDFVARDIISGYNLASGTGQPGMVLARSDLPTYILNNYPYGETPVTCRDRLADLCKAFGAPPSVGGVLDFFALSYRHDGYNSLNVEIRSLGARDAGTITAGELASGEDDRMSGFNPPEATRIIGIFDGSAGSLPTGYSKFAGRELRYNFLPLWDNTATYPAGAEVRAVREPYSDVYRCISENSGIALSNAAAWERVTYAEYLGSIQYSEWTDDKAVQWATSGYDAGNTSPFGRSVPDFNVVYNTGSLFTTTVDHVGSAADIPSHLGGPYRGFRILLANGDIVMHDGVTGFELLYDHNDYPGTVYIVEEHTGRVYRPQGDGIAETNEGWIVGGAPYHSIYNVDGAVPNTAGMATNRQSAVEVRYDIPGAASFLVAPENLLGWVPAALGPVPALLRFVLGGAPDQVVQGEVSTEFLAARCSLRFRLPFPGSTYGGIGEGVGGLYGGGAGTEPAVLDIANSTYASDGRRGFNHARADELGKLSGIATFMKISQYELGTANLIAEANMPVRCALRDIRDNVVIQDFTIQFNDKWEDVRLPFSGFRPYVPLSPEHIDSPLPLPVPELEAQDAFEWWAVKDVTFTLLTGYLDDGRFNLYNSQSSFASIAGQTVAAQGLENFRSALAGRSVRMAVDAFRFSKELTVVSDPDSSVNHEKIIREPDVQDHATALYYVKSEEEKARHPGVSLVFDTAGNTSVRYGDSVTVTNPAIGTHKIAVTRMEHSFLREGFRTRIYGSVRFE